jgi:hypothetical protein
MQKIMTILAKKVKDKYPQHTRIDAEIPNTGCIFANIPALDLCFKDPMVFAYINSTEKDLSIELRPLTTNIRTLTLLRQSIQTRPSTHIKYILTAIAANTSRTTSLRQYTEIAEDLLTAFFINSDTISWGAYDPVHRPSILIRHHKCWNQRSLLKTLEIISPLIFSQETKTTEIKIREENGIGKAKSKAVATTEALQDITYITTEMKDKNDTQRHVWMKLGDNMMGLNTSDIPIPELGLKRSNIPIPKPGIKRAGAYNINATFKIVPCDFGDYKPKKLNPNTQLLFYVNENKIKALYASSDLIPGLEFGHEGIQDSEYDCTENGTKTYTYSYGRTWMYDPLTQDIAFGKRLREVIQTTLSALKDINNVYAIIASLVRIKIDFNSDKSLVAPHTIYCREDWFKEQRVKDTLIAWTGYITAQYNLKDLNTAQKKEPADEEQKSDTDDTVVFTIKLNPLFEVDSDHEIIDPDTEYDRHAYWEFDNNGTVMVVEDAHGSIYKPEKEHRPGNPHDIESEFSLEETAERIFNIFEINGQT